MWAALRIVRSFFRISTFNRPLPTTTKIDSPHRPLPTSIKMDSPVHTPPSCKRGGCRGPLELFTSFGISTFIRPLSATIKTDSPVHSPPSCKRGADVSLGRGHAMAMEIALPILPGNLGYPTGHPGPRTRRCGVPLLRTKAGNSLFRVG